MGFWGAVGKIGKSVGKEAIKMGGQTLNQIKTDTEEMPLKTDAELFRIAKKANGLHQGAAVVELKKRGYDTEEIKARIS